MDPGFNLGYLFLGRAYGQTGKYDEALSAFEKSATSSGDHHETLGEVAHTHALAGNKKKTLEILDTLLKLKAGNTFTPYIMYSIATIYTALHDKKQALYWLEEAFKEHSFRLIYLKVDPDLQGLHSEPGFTQLLKKVGLEK
jgi:tetratricopeptide (TPR) repeat protein